jgi:uncharacterized repeat protein (TIGR01451 family)
MDNGAWSRCTSPAGYTGLTTAATHSFGVRAVSADGLADSTPARQTFTVAPAADLGVTLTAAPNPVKHGGTLTYTAVVSNAGPDAASGSVFTQGLPTGVSYTSVSVAPSSSQTAPSCTSSGSPATVRCELGALSPGGSWTVTVRATVTASKGSLASTAVVTTSGWDLSAGNDSASTSTKVGNGK